MKEKRSGVIIVFLAAYHLGGDMSPFSFEMSKGIYGTKRWIRLREKILRRDNYLCQVSKRYGKNVEATTVHHIFPATDYPEYQWCEWNLISLSMSAHGKMHDKENGELTDEGKRLQHKVARARGILLKDPRPLIQEK